MTISISPGSKKIAWLALSLSLSLAGSLGTATAALATKKSTSHTRSTKHTSHASHKQHAARHLHASTTSSSLPDKTTVAAAPAANEEKAEEITAPVSLRDPIGVVSKDTDTFHTDHKDHKHQSHKGKKSSHKIESELDEDAIAQEAARSIFQHSLAENAASEATSKKSKHQKRSKHNKHKRAIASDSLETSTERARLEPTLTGAVQINTPMTSVGTGDATTSLPAPEELRQLAPAPGKPAAESNDQAARYSSLTSPATPLQPATTTPALPAQVITPQSITPRAIAPAAIAPQVTPAQSPTLPQSPPQPQLTKPAAPAAPARTVQASERPSRVDAALVSVLRDIAKALLESDNAKQVDNQNNRAALQAAATGLAKALNQDNLAADRIIAGGPGDHGARSLAVESWDSGDITVSPDCHVSATAVWAKKPDGFLNISIAGCTGPARSPESQFLVVLNGSSAVTSGFDIQTQSTVAYWLGKLTNFHVEASEPGATAEKKSRLQILTSPLTVRQRLELANTNGKQPSEAVPTKVSTSGASGNLLPAAASTEARPQDSLSTLSLEPAQAGQRHRGGTTSAGTPARKPPLAAALVAPDRALAGQAITLAVIGPGGAAEPFIELSVNGSRLTTGADGKVSYLVPEDAPAGPSLLVGLASRPELVPIPVRVLHPLSTPETTPPPELERVSDLCEVSTPLILSGHNFSGTADENRVIIDDSTDATVVAASPVQLKAILPAGLALGKHQFTVSTVAGKSRNVASEVIAVQVDPGKDNHKAGRRMFVRVVGTENKVRLKLSNLTPAVIKLQLGDEQTLWTPGGAKNELAIPIYRVSEGAGGVSAHLQADTY